MNEILGQFSFVYPVTEGKKGIAIKKESYSYRVAFLFFIGNGLFIYRHWLILLPILSILRNSGIQGRF